MGLFNREYLIKFGFVLFISMLPFILFYISSYIEVNLAVSPHRCTAWIHRMVQCSWPASIASSTLDFLFPERSELSRLLANWSTVQLFRSLEFIYFALYILTISNGGGVQPAEKPWSQLCSRAGGRGNDFGLLTQSPCLSKHGMCLHMIGCRGKSRKTGALD